MTALCHVSPFPLNSMSGDSKEFVYGSTRSFFHQFLEIRFAHLLLKENEPQGIHSLKTLIDNNGSWSCLCHCLLGCSFAFIFVFQGAKSCSNLFWHTNFCTKAVQHRKKARKFNHRDSCQSLRTKITSTASLVQGGFCAIFRPISRAKKTSKISF